MASRLSAKRALDPSSPEEPGSFNSQAKKRHRSFGGASDWSTTSVLGKQPNAVEASTVKIASHPELLKIAFRTAFEWLQFPPAFAQSLAELYVLGQGDCGQLGKGEDFMEAKVLSKSPVKQKRLKAVAAGGVHSLALTEDNCVYSTGVNDEGALGRKTDNKLWEIEGGEQANDLQTRSDSVWEEVTIPATHGRPVAVSAGDSHSACLTLEGAIWAWGTFRDAGGVYSLQPGLRIALLPILVYKPASQEEAICKIVSGTDHMLALTTSGKVLSFGTGWQGQLGRIPKDSFSSFTAAKTAFRKAEGELEALETGLIAAKTSEAEFQKAYQRAQVELQKARSHFQPFDEDLMSLQLRPAQVELPSRAVEIAAGWYTSYVIDDSGCLFAFGLDNYGQASAVPATESEESDERFLFSPQQMQSLGAGRVKAVAAGIHHALVLTEAGQLLSFGRTTLGPLGRLNDEVDKNIAREQPKPVDGLYGVKVAQISAGEMVSACISASGTLFLWGSATNAQLGNSGRWAGTRAAGLEESELEPGHSDEILDEVIPWRLDSALLRDRKVHRVEFGGQHTLIMLVPK